MTDSAIYEAPGHPTVTLERTGTTIAVTVTGLTGLAPRRAPNSEELALGIESLSPPSGRTRRGEQRLIEIATRATLAAVESSAFMDAGGAAVIAQKLGHGVRSALELLPTAAAPAGIGTVFEG
jgi:hypothetical protein